MARSTAVRWRTVRALRCAFTDAAKSTRYGTYVPLSYSSTLCQSRGQRSLDRSEERDGVDRGARRAAEPERGDRQQELPATPLGARLRQVLEVHVVDQPEPEPDQGDDVERVPHRRVRRRRDVV